MASTLNYGLVTYNRVTDANKKFLAFRGDVGGDNDNMKKIDIQMKVNADGISGVESAINAISIGDSNALIGVYNSNDLVNTNNYADTITGLVLFDGMKLNINVANRNTGDSTFNLNGVGSIPILNQDGVTQITPGEMLGICQLQYDLSLNIYRKINKVSPTTNVYSVLDNGLIGDGIVNDATALNALITLIGSKQATIVFTALTTGQATYLISTNVVFPANINIEFMNGATLKVSNTFSVTGTNTKLTAGFYQIFDLSLGGTIEGTLKTNYILSQWLGAKADEITDDSDSLKHSIQLAIKTKLPLYLPAGKYLATKNILTVATNAISRVSGLLIYGDGNLLTTVLFKPTSDTICIDFTNVWFSQLKDFKIEGENEIGVGLRMGNISVGTVDAATYNCDFVNFHARGLDIGVDTQYAWGNSFVNLKVRYCKKGMIAYGGGMSFINFNAEANTEYGLKTITGLSETTISMNGALIENNPIGIVIEGGSLSMSGIYFEANATANIQAGFVNTVDSIIINGLHLGSLNKCVFDKVNYLKISGIDGYNNYNLIQVLGNVVHADIDASSEMLTGTLRTFMTTARSKNKIVAPVISNDLQDITTYSNPMPLDYLGVSKITSLSTTGSIATMDGKKVLKYLSTSGSFNGASLNIDFTNPYIKNHKKLLVKTDIFIDTTTFATIGNSRMYSKVRINYLDATLTPQLKEFYDVNPADADNTQYNLRNSHISHNVILDLDEMIATIPSFSSITEVRVYYYPIVSAIGGETFYIEGVEIYPHHQVNKVLTKRKNVNPFNTPVVYSPNGTKYTLKVGDTGIITAVVV